MLYPGAWNRFAIHQHLQVIHPQLPAPNQKCAKKTLASGCRRLDGIFSHSVVPVTGRFILSKASEGFLRPRASINR